MADLHEVLQNIQAFVFIGLALAALVHWLRRRSTPAAWIAATFGVLGAVILLGMVLPEEGANQWLTKGLLALLVLFPYFLYRFHTSLLSPRRWSWVTAHVLTGATLVAAILLPEFPDEGEPAPASFQVFLYVFLAQWVFLSGRVAFRLWRAGAGQPAVTRRRMRTIALGASFLSIVLVGGALSPDSDEVTGVQLATTTLGLLSAPLFLLGFAPPRAIVAVWRRKDDAALREAEIGLIQAVNSAEIAQFLLPRLSGFMGGGGAILTDREGRILGSHGLTEEEVSSMGTELLETPDRSRTGTLERVRLEGGWIAIVPSPLAPYFGEDERRTLTAIGALTDMALARAKLFEREQQSAETMRDFVAIASHDMRTPITVISGIGSTVRQQWHRLTDEERLDLVGRVEKQAQHLSRLVEDLLTVSKIESGIVTMRPERLEIATFVSEVLSELGDRARSIDVEVAEDAIITGDADLLRRILRNYLTNAFNYGADPIELSARPVNGWIEFRIADSGEGVPPEFVPRLFEKFARADKKISKASQGTGLGLSIVRGLARAMGGDAFYESNRPSGAVFGVRLPTSSAG